ncbi:chaperone modulator CbpM [Bacteroides sp.]|uniref:chaperone modulator CbpM n=1 Tax=Bacteroides sp. TaxID=29523 RepID=UPI002617F78B|nr:chaperone modulator CbpM [Bacteroides sp.]MDD3039225.1 chaperone modulator CbpM [Bacteroides sp.]
MQTELIIVSEYCHKCHIEPSFIDLLEEGGLIEVRAEDGEHYLLVSQLPEVERYSRMYYDLSINMEGIDAIHHLLDRMEDMRRELDSLHKQLLLYQGREIEDIDW